MHPRFQCWQYKTSKLLVVKISGGWHGGRNCQSLKRVCLKDHMALECTQTHLLWDSAPEKQLEGCQQHTGSGGSAWKKAKSPANGSVPSQTPPSHTVLQSRLSHPAEYVRLFPLHYNRLYWHKRWSQSSSTQYTERNTGRLPN